MSDSWRPADAAPLRLVILRLASTKPGKLPHVAPVLADYLAESKSVGKANESADTIQITAEHAVLFHDIKTRISALFQDKANESHYTAILLAKALVENARPSILQDTLPWARSINSILKVSTRTAVISILGLCKVQKRVDLRLAIK